MIVSQSNKIATNKSLPVTDKTGLPMSSGISQLSFSPSAAYVAAKNCNLLSLYRKLPNLSMGMERSYTSISGRPEFYCLSKKLSMEPNRRRTLDYLWTRPRLSLVATALLNQPSHRTYRNSLTKHCLSSSPYSFDGTPQASSFYWLIAMESRYGAHHQTLDYCLSFKPCNLIWTSTKRRTVTLCDSPGTHYPQVSWKH